MLSPKFLPLKTRVSNSRIRRRCFKWIRRRTLLVRRVPIEKLAELLSGLVSQPSAAGRNMPYGRPFGIRAKALICVPEEHRESIARNLTEAGYQVFVAEDTRQAVDRMRENLLDVVLLDPQI